MSGGYHPWSKFNAHRWSNLNARRQADQALRCLYPQDAGHTVDFSQDRVLSSVFADLVALREHLAEQEKLEARLKQQLQEAMGNASSAVFETGAVSWKKAKDSVGLDVATLLKSEPELITRYPLVKPGSRRFLVM